MFLHALATAVPPAVLTQRQCWEIGRDSPAVQRLNRRSQLVLRAILTGNSGIATRHLHWATSGRISALRRTN